MMARKLVKKCCICDKPVFSIKSIYCRTCSHFSARMSDERFSPAIREDLWRYVRKHGYVCYYTQDDLDVFVKSSAYFLEFDRVIPGDPRKIVITSALVNEMKGDMTEKEFKSTVRQLYNCWFKHIKMKKRKYRYWYRLTKPGSSA